MSQRGCVGSTALSSAEGREMLATRFEGSWPHGQSVPTDCEDFGSTGPSSAVVKLGPLSCACPRLLESYHLTTSGVIHQMLRESGMICSVLTCLFLQCKVRVHRKF